MALFKIMQYGGAGAFESSLECSDAVLLNDFDKLATKRTGPGVIQHDKQLLKFCAKELAADEEQLKLTRQSARRSANLYEKHQVPASMRTVRGNVPPPLTATTQSHRKTSNNTSSNNNNNNNNNNEYMNETIGSPPLPSPPSPFDFTAADTTVATGDVQCTTPVVAVSDVTVAANVAASLGQATYSAAAHHFAKKTTTATSGQSASELNTSKSQQQQQQRSFTSKQQKHQQTSSTSSTANHKKTPPSPPIASTSSDCKMSNVRTDKHVNLNLND